MSHYPALSVEFGAVFVLIAALLARILSRGLDIPSIVTLLARGLLPGPGGLNALHINLTDPPTRALLTLAVVVVLFEVALRGGHQLAAAIFLVVIITIVLSTTASISVSRLFRLQMPSLLIAGISPATLDCARRFRDRGHMPFLVDTDELSVTFARSSNADAECITEPREFLRLAHQHKAAFVIVESLERWEPYLAHLRDVPVLSVGSEDESRLLEGIRLGEPESRRVAQPG